jgi:hypothetical protein
MHTNPAAAAQLAETTLLSVLAYLAASTVFADISPPTVMANLAAPAPFTKAPPT